MSAGTATDLKWRPGSKATIAVVGPESKVGFVHSNKNTDIFVVDGEEQDHPHFALITCFDWMNDGSLATGDQDGSVHLWDIRSSKKKDPFKAFA